MTTVIIISFLIGIAAGGVAGFLYARVAAGKLSVKADMHRAESERLAAELRASKEREGALASEAASLRTSAEVLNSRMAQMEADAVRRSEEFGRRVKEERERASEALELERRRCKEQIDEANLAVVREREHAKELREENDRQWQQRFETMREELHKTTIKELSMKQADLQENNRRQMDELMKPIKEQFADFKKSIEESRTQNEVSKKEIKQSFESTMKLFQQTQEQAVNSLSERTQRIGDDASNLTKALKGDSKVQGDFGEMLLEKMLESSGLRKDEEYFIQESTKNDEGRSMRPDVVVRFPEGRSVVIDSKVSLTAYADAVCAETDEQRERFLKEHVRSVRRHIDELAEKNYASVVGDAIGYVLMYMPIESGYIAAMKSQPDLSQYAYKKRIIVISPSNLMMALQLAYNLWQYDRQGKNVEQIVKSAADMYEKMAGFSETFIDIETQINRLSKAYATAKDRLYEGRGNIMRRMENLKSLGVTPKKQIRGLEDTDD